MKHGPLFLFLVILLNTSLFAQVAKQPVQEKLSPGLSSRIKTVNEGDSIVIYIAARNAEVLKGYPILYTYKSANSYLVRIKVNEIVKLVNQPNVLFADVYEHPKEELTTATLDLATNKVNLVHSIYPELTGQNLLVSLKENKPDTADLDYLGRYVNTGLSASTISPHASIMATTIVGAGNTSHFSKGVAIGSHITSSNFASVLPDNDNSYIDNAITVQNHSYGTVVQNYYGIEAAAYDVNASKNVQLLHVFSSGNSGSLQGTGTYTGIEGFANLTGNFKQAKNTIAVGAIDSFYKVSPLSSKGPAFDGRVKPELVAFGEDGSSGAAAMVSGSALLIQQAYKMKYGSLPGSSTIKAVLVNSATDVHTKGIDYASGYGNLNTYKAVKTILNERITESAIQPNSTKRMQVVVPDNASQLKVTLVWTDPAATVNASKVLVNDLDMVVITPDNQVWLPWVLNPVANKESLQNEAERKKDTLNNVEQVTIDLPNPGTYTIEVTAPILQTNEQGYSIAYQIDTMETLYWTFPAAADKLQSSRTSVIRWETNTTGPAAIEFSTDKQTWTTIANVPDVAIGYLKWAVPDVSTTAWLRLKRNGQTIVSDTFVISAIPRMDVGLNCADSFLLLWNRQPVSQYEVYELGSKYLQTIAISPDTFYLAKKSQHTSIYYSVAPVVKGKPGMRAFVLNYKAQGVDCYFKSFFLQNQTASNASFFGAIGTTYGVASISLQKQEGADFKEVSKINTPASTVFTLIDPAMKQGLNRYRLALQLTNGQILYSEIVPAYYFNNKNVIIYPNPARQQQPIHIITSRAGRTTIQLFDGSGAMVKEIRLKNLQHEIPAMQLNAGFYLIKVIDQETGAVSTQKLIIQ